MRKYKMSFDGTEVDLDDPELYKNYPNTDKELDNLMFCEIGKTLVYMDYFESRKHLFPKRKKKDKFAKLSDWYPDLEGTEKGNRIVEIGNSGYNQRQRVYKLIQNFADNRKDNYNNLMWYKEQIFLLQDETENMC